MRISLTRNQFDELKEAGITNKAVTRPQWGGDSVSFDSYAVPVDYIDRLAKFAATKPDEYNGVLQKISLLRKFKNTSDMLITRLDLLEHAISGHLAKTAPNRWLFDQGKRAYLVTRVAYDPANRSRGNDEPAVVRVNLAYMNGGKKCTGGIFFQFADLMGVDGRRMNVAELLAIKGYEVETPELIEKYQSDLEDWTRKWDDVNKQFIYHTHILPDATDFRGEIDWRARYMSNGKVESHNILGEYKVVNDRSMIKLEEEFSAATRVRVGVSKIVENDDGDESVEEDDSSEAYQIFQMPLHFHIFVFNLESHSYMWVESRKLTPYRYCTDLVDKLILPLEHKALIKLLVDNPDTLQADVVNGKSSGTIIMAYGPPGVGKTLSAEAFSEGTERILYRVQSDQLGIKVDDIEKNLKAIFARAHRWGAVLLIDEADIYVRERGTDIQQNAIVGTMLRTFEYYNGILFMTTNMKTECDDAIISRCSAVLEYSAPTINDAKHIFDIFCDLFQYSRLNLGEVEQVRQSVLSDGKMPSGRFIKNMIRLAVRRGFREGIAHLIQSSKYLR